MKTVRPSSVISHSKKMPNFSKPGINLLQRGWKALLCTAALLAFVAMVPKADGHVSINIGGPPPVCPYGYYDYAPYSCAPVGFYGPGYFYNNIFLGVGPWRHWGYRNGWGSHRFVSSGGGRYRPRPYNGRPGYSHGRPVHGGRPGYRPGPSHGVRPGGPRPGNVHSNAGRPGGGARPGGGRPGGGRPGGDRPGGPR